MKIEHLFMGVKDKILKLEEFCKQLKVNFSQVAFIGDDLNDLVCIKNVGLGVYPAEALDEVKKAALTICQNEGGEGAVGEFCDLLLTKSS